MADLRIFSYLPNPRLYKATIAARFSGAKVETLGEKPLDLVNWFWDFDARRMTDADREELSQFARQGTVGFANIQLYKSDAFLEAHPFGNVPAGFSGDGSVGVFESNAIMRAAARAGSEGEALLGRDMWEASRIDSFLDRSLVYARDLQRYLLAGDAMSPELHAEMASELTAFATGLDRALQSSPFIVGDQVTLADIGPLCDLCQLTYERGHKERFETLGLEFLVPTLRPHAHLGAYLKRLSEDERFSEDLGRYFETLLPVFE
ncbi:MAG: glutathione S-transferase family protein [Pseudomonadota bacterium]